MHSFYQENYSYPLYSNIISILAQISLSVSLFPPIHLPHSSWLYSSVSSLAFSYSCLKELLSSLPPYLYKIRIIERFYPLSFILHFSLYLFSASISYSETSLPSPVLFLMLFRSLHICYSHLHTLQIYDLFFLAFCLVRPNICLITTDLMVLIAVFTPLF